MADAMKIDGTAFEPKDPVALRQLLQSSGREPSQICLNFKKNGVQVMQSIFARKRFVSLIFAVRNRKYMP